MRASIGGSAKHLAKVATPPRIDGRRRGYWIGFMRTLEAVKQIGSVWFDGYRPSRMTFSPHYDLTTMGTPLVFSWHPSGEALAFNSATAPYLYVFGFKNGQITHQYPNPASLPTAASNTSPPPTWHPDGRAIAIAMTGTPFVEAWRFDLKAGFGAKYADPADLPAVACRGPFFSTTGRYIAAAPTTGTTIHAWDWTEAAGFGTRYDGTCTVSPRQVYWNSSDDRVFVQAADDFDFFDFSAAGWGAKTTIDAMSSSPTQFMWPGYKRKDKSNLFCGYSSADFGRLFIDDGLLASFMHLSVELFGPHVANDFQSGLVLGWESWSPDWRFLAGRCTRAGLDFVPGMIISRLPRFAPSAQLSNPLKSARGWRPGGVMGTAMFNPKGPS